MDALLAQLLPLALLGALAPLPILISLSLLMSQGGLATAVAFDAALAGVFALIGTVSLVSSGRHASASDEGSAVTGTVIAVLGVLFIVIAVKQLLRVPDPDAPPPKFMTVLDTMSVARAAIFGVILGFINVKQLGIFVGGVAQIVHADVSRGQQWVAMVLFLAAFQVGVVVPVVLYLSDPQRAMRELLRARSWLVAHNRVLGIVLGLVIGVWFTVMGIAQIA
jgi:cytochrome c biogenesis protein CcdA